jgi:hypothetical protein
MVRSLLGGRASSWVLTEMEAWVARLEASAEHLAQAESQAAAEHRAVESYTEAAGAMAIVIESPRAVGAGKQAAAGCRKSIVHG